MSIRTITPPEPGERLLGLSPPDAAAAARTWQRRPHLFAGRALDAAALQQRQHWQAGHVAARGRMALPGVMDGLWVLAQRLSVGNPLARTVLQVEPGRALCANGEDVALPQGLRLALADVPVVAPRVFFQTGNGVSDPQPDGSLRDREVGVAMGQLNPAARAALPRLGVLVLQPVAAPSADFDTTSPCDRTPFGQNTPGAQSGALEASSREDWRERDGARLLWYVWPSEWASAAAPLGQTRTPAQLRSLLAARIFGAEGRLGEGQSLPWEAFGAPLALCLLDEDFTPHWLDRASVVRSGGMALGTHVALRTDGAAPRVRSQARAGALWQARIEQFAETVAAANTADPSTLRSQFMDELPPVGLLPAACLDAVAGTTAFFPVNFEVEAAPVPMEQLDLAVRACAGLAPLNLAASEGVRLLVPVPLAQWEPRLLHQERVADEFTDTLQHFELQRARHLGARQALRLKRAVLDHALQGSVLAVPALDDDAAGQREALAPWGPPPAGGGHRSALKPGVHQHYFERASLPHALQGDRLFAWVYLDPDQPPRTLMLQWHTQNGNWEHRAFWGEDLVPWGTPGSASRQRLGDLPATGRWLRLEVPAASVGLAAGQALDGMAFTLFDGRAAYGMAGSGTGNSERKWFCNVLPEGALRQGDEAWQLLTANDLWAPFEPSFEVQFAEPGTLPPQPGGHFDAPAPAQHEHGLENVAPALALAANESLYAWVWLDPNQPPAQLMLEWRDATGVAGRASWGQPNGITRTGPANTEQIGPLPQPGRWVRLVVPPTVTGQAALNLGGRNLNAMAFIVSNGHAAFGATGAVNGNGQDRLWFAGAPPGATRRGLWNELAGADMAAPTPSAGAGQVAAVHALYEHAALAPLSTAERAQLYRLGVAGFTQLLKTRADRADDLADYAFVKVQTDVYRVRQLVLGSTVATRLAVSPALAGIAQAETAVASQTQIADFVAGLRSKAVVAPLPGVAAALPAAAPKAVARTAFAAMPGAVATAATGVEFPDTPSLLGSPFIVGKKVLTQDVNTNLFKLAKNDTETSPFITAKAVSRTADIKFIGPVVAASPTPSDIANASPVVGQSFVRTTTIARRLEDPKSKEARDYATATRFDALRSLHQFAVQLTAEDGGITPGLFEGLEIRGLQGDTFLADLDGEAPNARRTGRPFAQFLQRPQLLQALMTVPSRVVGTSTDPDEAAFFSDSTDLSDHVISLARQLEGRIRLYRGAVAECERVLAQLRGTAAALGARLNAVGEDLAEARHDVTVGISLLAEETERINAINARRVRVLREEVKFVAYVRARETDTLRATPTHAVDPGLVAPAVPACLREHTDMPEALESMLRVVREAPARYFVAAPPLLQRFDRLDQLQRLVLGAQARTLALAEAPPLALPALSALQGLATSTRLAQTVSNLALRQAAGQASRVAAIKSLALHSSMGWAQAQAQAQAALSFADLAEGGHGRAEVARAAARELDQIQSVATCLHAGFGAVLPSLRLDWAEALSEFDATPNLRNLASLPRFAEVPFLQRRSLQGLVDWLFAQVEPGVPQAVALVNDVVRMCLLLASHAPVGRLVHARLARPMPNVRPGLNIPLRVQDMSRARIGMQAVLMRGSQVLARAVVQDVAGGELTARVVHTLDAAGVNLGLEVSVHLGDAPQLSLQSAAAQRTRFNFKGV